VGLVVGSTALFTLRARPEQAQAVTGPGAAFVLMGAWMSCFHFMFYDVLLTAFPVLLLCTRPDRFVRPSFLVFVPARGWWCGLEWLPRPFRLSRQRAGEGQLAYHQPRRPTGYPPPVPLLRGCRSVWVVNDVVLSLIVVVVATLQVFPYFGQGVNNNAQPWDTYCLLALWAWCGWTWLRTPGAEKAVHPVAPAALGKGSAAVASIPA
jgi:hypothetical protein